MKILMWIFSNLRDSYDNVTSEKPSNSFRIAFLLELWRTVADNIFYFYLIHIV